VVGEDSRAWVAALMWRPKAMARKSGVGVEVADVVVDHGVEDDRRIEGLEVLRHGEQRADDGGLHQLADVENPGKRPTGTRGFWRRWEIQVIDYT
jgi:hypothetical protein